MSLRALGSLLTRRFAQAQAPGRPARSLHSRRDLAVGHRSHGAVVAAAALSGGFAFLYFKKDTDDESAGKVILENTSKEVTDKKPGHAKKVISEVTASSESIENQQDMKAEFEDWMNKYKKTYRDEEEKSAV